MLNTAGRQNDSVGSMGANEPANGEDASSRARRSTCTARSTRRRSTTRATPTARPASAATSPGATSTARRSTRTSRSTPHDNVTIGPTYKTYDKAGRGQGLNRQQRARGPDLHARSGRDRGAAAAMRRNQRTGIDAVRGRGARAWCSPSSDLPRLHEVDPVPQPLRDQGRLPDRQQRQAELAVRIAGVNVGKVTKVELPAQGPAAGGRDDADRRRGACRSTRTPR